MPRFVDFEDAVSFARKRHKVTLASLVEGLDASPPAAASLLRRLEADGIVGPADEYGAHIVHDSHSRRSWQRAGPTFAAGPDHGGEVAHLRAALAQAERRAREAEEKLAHAGHGDDRASTLRRLLVRALHPDSDPEAPPELKALQTELFKRLWPRIERALDGEEDERVW